MRVHEFVDVQLGAGPDTWAATTGHALDVDR